MALSDPGARQGAFDGGAGEDDVVTDREFDEAIEQAHTGTAWKARQHPEVRSRLTGEQQAALDRADERPRRLNDGYDP